MELKTKRLIIRKAKKSDWKDIVEGIGEYDVCKMLFKVPFPYAKKDAEDFIKKTFKKWNENPQTNYDFLIELKSEKKVIGAIGLINIDYFSGTAETGSWINKKYWRNGYVTEAKIAINDFAFNKLKLRRLNSQVYKENKASNRTQQKMGYVLEGVQRKAKKILASGKIQDVNIYGGIQVANGKYIGAVFFKEYGHDVAALKIITEEAGGKVTDLNGNERRYDQDGTGCIVSNGILHKELLDIVQMGKL